MSSDRVIVIKTTVADGKTRIEWRAYKAPGLTGFVLSFSDTPQTFSANPADTELTVGYAATPGVTKITVTPTTADGPKPDLASRAIPAPFPPPPPDPDSQRPTTVFSCADADTVTVAWLSSTYPNVASYILTIFQDKCRLTNFEVPDPATVKTTVTYACDPRSQYQVMLTPCDEFGMLSPEDYASLPVAIPYP